MGGLGSVERILAHGAPGGLRAAKAVQRLHKGGGAALAHSTPRLDVKIKVFIHPKAGQNGAALAAPCVGTHAHPRALGPQPGKSVPHAGLQLHLFIQLGDHLAHHVQIAVPVQRQRIFPDEVLCAVLHAHGQQGLVQVCLRGAAKARQQCLRGTLPYHHHAVGQGAVHIKDPLFAVHTFLLLCAPPGCIYTYLRLV